MDMNALFQLQRMQAKLADVRTRMAREMLLRDLYADRFDSSVLGAFANNFVGDTLDSVLQGENPFREALRRLIVPVRAGGAQWAGDDTWTPDRKAHLTALQAIFREAVTTLAITGKLAVLPWKGPDGKVRSTVLKGYLHPIYDRNGDLERLLNITVGDSGAQGLRYDVWNFQPGKVTIHSDLDDPTRYALSKGTPIDLTYAAGRLPLAFVSFEQDGEGQPYGPGDVAYSSFRRFLERLVQENTTYRSAAFKQRVIYGNNGGTPTMGPFTVLELDEGAKYEEHGADTPLLVQMTASRQGAGRDVWAAAGAPETVQGAGESGDARAIAGQGHEQTCQDLGDLTAQAFTDATDLLSRMGAIPKPIEFTNRPLFLAKRAAEQQNIVALQGTLSRYERLLRLQDAGMKISQEELAAAKKERDNPQPTPAPADGKVNQ